jgi:peptidoglycan hydrolase-like protein with peptidoglycan-binding domain
MARSALARRLACAALVLVRIATAISVCTVLLAAACMAPGPAAASPFDGRGMWIWYVSRTEGGNPSAIAARARSAGIKTLFIKSGDGGSYWSQFSRSLVRSLHAGGVKVCAWQYVYGTNPRTEAAVGAHAVRNGADCLVIDAEAEYEGRYASAQTYIDALRAAVGSRYPVGLASFPYVDYHPSFPYSVFLGHGGAQFNLPQMYWRDIGTSVEAVYQHTYTYNRIYRRPIRPLGQTDGGASSSEIALFRGLSVGYQAGGLSWWDFAWSAANGLWSALSGPYTSISRIAPLGFPLLGYGSTGDTVLWMQELLASAIPAQRTTGIFASETLTDLRSFQARHRIPATGQTGPLTWRALLRLRAVRVRWAAADVASARRTHATRESGSRLRIAPAPQSAALHALAYEIHKPTGIDGAR